MDDYQSFISLSRYARWLPEKKRRETWEETVDRYVDFFVNKGLISQEESLPLRKAKKELKVMGSMRATMTAGKALDRDNVAGFNCAYVAVDHPRVFDEIMYVLMCGTGMGFSVERQFINKLPEVADSFHPTETTIVVRDSKMGWAASFKELISLLYAGNVPKWDVSKVRPAGARLKTFGGRASGPQPLVDLFNFSVALFKKAAGRKLTSIECHDLVCKIADIVVVGGVRRSALISLSNLSDDRIRGAKSGQWWNDNPQRALANNSVAYTEKPDFESFLKEWHSLYESKSGERGMFSRVAAKRQAAKSGRRDVEHEFGCNPCCFTGDMRLLTSLGYKTFEELLDSEFCIINKDGSHTLGKVWCSGEKDVVEIKFTNTKTPKNSITCTPDHIFLTTANLEVEAKDLKGHRLMPFLDIKRDFDSYAFMAGFIQGDGNCTRLLSNKHKGMEVNFSEKDGDVAEIFKLPIGKPYSQKVRNIATRFGLSPAVLPERGWPSSLNDEDIADFLSGVFSANGCVILSGKRVALKGTCKEFIDDVQKYLERMFNISSYVTINKPKKVAFDNGEYLCKRSYDLNITGHDNILKFSSNISFAQKYKQESLKKLLLETAPLVSKIINRGTDLVYDFTEPDTHWGVVEGVIAHNSEIILRESGQMCNLSEVVIRPDDTLEDLAEKVRIATIFGTLQSTLTDFRYLRPIWAKNTSEERLLGVSLTGIMDHPIMSGRDSSDFKIKDGKNVTYYDLKSALEYLKEIAIETNKEWAKKLDIEQSTAITCVKPSGTVSQLVNSASGIHARFSDYYIRTVRADKKDPLAQMMTDVGFPVEDCVLKGDTTQVFSFPQKSPEGSIKVSDMSAMDQLRIWKLYQDYWCEHKPSVTVYYKDEEFLEIGQWLYNNFNDVSGISFLPYSEHTYAQAPYQEITQEQYEDFVAKMPTDVDWSKLGDYEEEDNTAGTQTMACTGSVCEIVDLTK